MLRNSRVLFLRQGALVDISAEMSDFLSASKVIDYTAGDYLYIGSDLPFNHRYVDVKTANTIAAALSVDIWVGSAWEECVDVIDETSVAGIPLSQSGIISFQVDIDRSTWGYDDTDEMNNSGIETGPKIFGLYWARLKYSATLNALTELQYMGHKFSDDSALENEYPELGISNVKTAFKAGKTTWKDQAITAAEYIIHDLKGKKNLIRSADQILEWDIFEKASIHKTAEIIFRAFGDDYRNNMLDANTAYKEALSVGKFNIDENRNANLDEDEKKTNVEYISR